MKTAFFALTLCLALASAREDSWKKIAAPLNLSFPRDHGSHEDFQTEWWYATGSVSDVENGARFGWQLTVFRRGLEFGPRTGDESLLVPRQVFAGHFVLIDLTSKKLVASERVRREFPRLATASSARLDVALEGWTFVLSDEGVLRAQAIDRATKTSLDLTLVPKKPLVLHGEGGVSTKGSEFGNASGYVSWTRLATSGSIEFDGRKHNVVGESWFDHEWGSSALSADVVGWDWFGLRLDDGRELMLYRLRKSDGGIGSSSSGTLVSVDGSTRSITQADFTLVDMDHWTSPRTKARYSKRWNMKIEAHAIDIVIETEAEDCEIDARGSTGNVYWEGPVKVSGSVLGSGYGELTGYTESMGGKL